MHALTPGIASCKSHHAQPVLLGVSTPSLLFHRMLTEDISAPAAPASADKPLVLVVDDEYGPRESIAFSLASDFSVDTAEKAREALERLKSRPYAAVVLDIRMPEMDGIRALEELRIIDPHVSVIMLTGYGTLLTAQQAMLAGANQYMRKPPTSLGIGILILPAKQFRNHILQRDVLDRNVGHRAGAENFLRNRNDVFAGDAKGELPVLTPHRGAMARLPVVGKRSIGGQEGYDLFAGAAGILQAAEGAVVDLAPFVDHDHSFA